MGLLCPLEGTYGAPPVPPTGSPGAVEAALGALAALFPAGLFGDLLPPLVLRHQLYSIVSDRTAVDRHLDRLRADGRIRLLHVGLGTDTLGVVSMDSYREKVGPPPGQWDSPTPHKGQWDPPTPPIRDNGTPQPPHKG
uniref:Uncharacterized protein n=1 Tax=Strigops habroptila TaxID=2489341 RepID=A0A672TXW8_STRHB